MNVLMISPVEKSLGIASINTGTQILQGLLYVAAASKRAGHPTLVTIADENNILEMIQMYKPQVVGFSCVTMSYPSMKAAIELVKKEHPGIYTILGGHHATFMTHEIFAECPVDYICRGEGEIAFPALLDSLDKGDPYPIVEGMAFRKDGQVHNADKITLLETLDNLPLITLDLVTPGLSFSPKIVSSRGCPFKCSFCSISAFYSGKYRQRSIEDVMYEVQLAYDAGHSEFWFHDDNLTVNGAWVREFCAEVHKRKMKISWNCMSRIDTIIKDPDLIKTMAKAGCGQISIGIESGIQAVLESYKKKTNVEEVKKAAKILRKSGIFYLLFMIIGSGDQYDTPEYFEENIRFFESIPFDLVTISLLTPLPGTEVYKKLNAENRILHREWLKYDMIHCVYEPLGMTASEMEAWMPRAYKRIYLKRGLRMIPSIILGIQRKIYRPKRIWYFVRFMFNLAGKKMVMDEALRKSVKEKKFKTKM